MFMKNRLQMLTYWIMERERVRQNREAGKPRPWSKDPIFQTTRFCNVRRMDDKVSRWLVDNWYPNNVGPSVILPAAGLARLINWPDSLEGLRAPRAGVFTKWDIHKAREHFYSLRDAGKKIFTGAYIINGALGGSKVDIVIGQINSLYVRSKELIEPASMQRTHANLQSVPGIGSFIAGQIVADLRHVYQKPMWQDRDKWAPIGPGSRRGMAWLEGWNGRDKLPAMRQDVFCVKLRELMTILRTASSVSEVDEDRGLEAHDYQNCLCEFDKFMRLREGTGRAKNKFAGVAL